MATEGRPASPVRRWVLLAVLVAVAIVALLVWRPWVPAVNPAGTSNTATRVRATGAKAPEEDLDVKLDALQAEREKPAGIERNPFRFEARHAPAPSGEEAVRRPAPRPEIEPPPAPAGPPPPPPIPLKFIGIIESPTAGRVAALSDGRRVYHGRVGDIIEGRYRIVRIGVESIVMEYADGTGSQQTIRLSGS